MSIFFAYFFSQPYLDSFAAGINAYAQEHPELIDDEVEVVLPVTGEDILAHLQRVLYFTFVVDPEKVADLSAEQRLEQKYSNGSNAWAIAPNRSASGNSMLLANPHLPWSDLFLWYEAQLTAPGINAYGATLVGAPVLVLAFNEHLGWTHTVNTFDGWDLYKLTQKQLRPVWHLRQEVEEHLVERTVLEGERNFAWDL